MCVRAFWAVVASGERDGWGGRGEAIDQNGIAERGIRLGLEASPRGSALVFRWGKTAAYRPFEEGEGMRRDPPQGLHKAGEGQGWRPGSLHARRRTGASRNRWSLSSTICKFALAETRSRDDIVHATQRNPVWSPVNVRTLRPTALSPLPSPRTEVLTLFRCVPKTRLPWARFTKARKIKYRVGSGPWAGSGQRET